MITVKSTKAAEVDAVAADRFRFEERKPSKVPFAFGMLLAGLVFYLRDLFSSEAGTGGDKESQSAEEEKETADPVVLAGVTAPPVPQLDKFTTGAVSAPLAPIDAPQSVAPLPSANVKIVDTPAFPLLTPERGLDVRIPFPFQSTNPRPVNDNAPRTGRESAVANGRHADDPEANRDDDDDDREDHDGNGDEDDVGEDDEKHDPTSNRAPIVSGPVQLYDIFGCGAVLVALSDFLRNASDPEGDVLSIRNLTATSGTFNQIGDDWLYDPSSVGPVTLSYEVTDGELSVPQKAYLTVTMSPPLIGSDADDIIVGADCADEIDGGAGNDMVDARGGSDTIDGGAGDDNILAGDGNDIVRGGAGDDVIFGGAGDDRIWGGAGNDRLFGGAGDDVLHGEDGDDLLAGDAGSDIVLGGAGNDIILGDVDGADDFYDGGAGNDTIDYSAASLGIEANLATGMATGADIGSDTIRSFEIFISGAGDDTITGSDAAEAIHGNDGNDTIDAGGGDDLIHDGAGSDMVDAGDGDDTVVAAADGADDVYVGGEGSDTLTYVATKSGIVIDLWEKTASGVEIGTDTIDSFETIVGGSGDDTFIVSGESVRLAGGDGDDVFDFSELAESGLASQVIHEILDFMVGDRVKISQYEIFEEVVDTLEDRFENIYGDVDDDDLPIRIRHERTDDMRTTYIEADMNRDDIYELTIKLEGNHMLTVVEQA